MNDGASKKIHVLAIGYGRNLFSSGDAERQRMIACAQAVASYHMIIFSHQRDHLDVVTENGLTLHPTNSRFSIIMLWDAFWLGKKIMATHSGAWVITAQDPFEAGLVGWLLAKSAKTALNLQEHADYFSTKYWRRDSFANGLRYYLGRFLLARADTVRVVSKRIKNTISLLGVSTERIFSLPVRSDQIVANTSETIGDSVLRQRYPDALIVLTMARLVSQKNLPLLIRAYATLAKNKPEALLVIVGSGAQENILRDMVQKLELHERILFLPWTDNPRALLKEADIYALSSNWEGWARVLIEAMASGVPVVTTDVGRVGEVFIDGEHGYVVPVADEKKFAERLLALAENATQRTRFGAAAKVAVAEFHMSQQEYATAWAEVLESTLGLHRK